MNSLANAERLLRRYQQAHTAAPSETDSDIPSDAEIEYSESFLPGRAASPLAAAAAAVPTSLSLSPSTSTASFEPSSLDVAPPFPRGWAATAARSSQATAAAATRQSGRGMPTSTLNSDPNAASQPSAPYKTPYQTAPAPWPPAAPTPWAIATASAAPTPQLPQLEAPLPEAVQRQLEDAAAATESLFRMLSSPLDGMLSAQSSRLEGQEEQQHLGEQGSRWEARQAEDEERHTGDLQQQCSEDNEQQQQQQQPCFGKEEEQYSSGAPWVQQCPDVRVLPTGGQLVAADGGPRRMEEQRLPPSSTGNAGASSPSSLPEAVLAGRQTASWSDLECQQQAECRAAVDPGLALGPTNCSIAPAEHRRTAAAGGVAAAAGTVEAGAQTCDTLDQAVQAGGGGCTCSSIAAGAQQQCQWQQQQEHAEGRVGCGTACCRAMGAHCCNKAGTCHSCLAVVPCGHCHSQLGSQQATLRACAPAQEHHAALSYGAAPPQQLSQQQLAAARQQADGLLQALNQAALRHAEQGAQRAELFARVQPLWWSQGAVLQQACENEAARRKLGELVGRLQVLQAEEASGARES